MSEIGALHRRDNLWKKWESTSESDQDRQETTVDSIFRIQFA